MRVDERIAALRQVDAEIRRMEAAAHRQWIVRLDKLRIAEAREYARLVDIYNIPDNEDRWAQMQDLSDTLTALLRAKEALMAVPPTWTTMPGAEELINRRERLLCKQTSR